MEDRISKHISLKEATKSETATKLGISNMPNATELANMKLLAEKCFEPIREWYGKPITVNSFFRSIKLNSSISGSSGTSQHCLGQAIDISASADNKKLFDYAKQNLDFDQLIAEFPTNSIPSWVHVSYKNTGNRKQILVAKKINGKSTYIPYKSDEDLK
jgi:hypothetical protein